MDISERRLPQDGRIRIRLGEDRPIDFRVSSLPTLWGEKLVLRVLDTSRSHLEIDRLGFAPEQESLFRSALNRPQGMILVTGPTGSGKTVTLYSGLATLNTERRNVSTAEDPVEFNLPGINQLQINPRIGLNFAAALRTFLRQDPDVIMVGEVRDGETAEIAVKAAQTGHLVLSTLHTNSAVEALTRLQNMGIAAWQLCTSIELIVAQRLARRLCEQCRKPGEIPAQWLNDERLGSQLASIPHIYRAVGCNHCHEGYVGRIGIYEVVPINGPMTRTIIAGGSSMEVAEEARKAGFISLRQAAIDKVRQGLTTLDEALRLT
jgi:type IV pilus assembly protein PilB